MSFKSDILVDLYYKLPGYFLPYRLKYFYNKLLENFFLVLINKYVPPYFEKTKDNPDYRLTKDVDDKDCKLIVSLTSFPARIHTTHLAVESILRQSTKPDKIILWLAEEDFPNLLDGIPESLKSQMPRGLDIRFCEDLRSHKKYYFVLKWFPDCKVVIVDDDLFFHNDLIKNLVELNMNYPNSVVSTRVHKMKFDRGVLLPYRQWHLNYSGDSARIILHHNSGHGTLLDTSTLRFDDVFFNKDLIRKISMHSDDVWFKVNLIRLKITVATNSRFKRDTIGIRGSYKTSLVSRNTHQGLKDQLFGTVFSHFNIDPTERYLKQIDRELVSNPKQTKN
jgi:hypothetical protein